MGYAERNQMNFAMGLTAETNINTTRLMNELDLYRIQCEEYRKTIDLICMTLKLIKREPSLAHNPLASIVVSTIEEVLNGH